MILVRHGQSQWNAAFNRTRIDPDIPDPHLTDEGREQAAAAAAELARRGVARLIVSPYTRTLQTAAVIAGELGLPIEIEPLVRERAAFSCDVGTSRSDLARRWPHLRFDHLDEIWWPAQESDRELADRCSRFRTSMQVISDWPRVAVITHWGFIRGLTGHEVHNGALVPHDPTGPWSVESAAVPW
ncbi:MAG: histidine phosphatase family protein [Dongiaceae bacterium]